MFTVKETIPVDVATAIPAHNHLYPSVKPTLPHSYSVQYVSLYATLSTGNGEQHVLDSAGTQLQWKVFRDGNRPGLGFETIVGP